jgi:hypothetical protein
MVQDGDNYFIAANISLWPIISGSYDVQAPTTDGKMDPRLFV